MLHTLNLHSAVCQLYLNKTARRRGKQRDKREKKSELEGSTSGSSPTGKTEKKLCAIKLCAIKKQNQNLMIKQK